MVREFNLISKKYIKMKIFYSKRLKWGSFNKRFLLQESLSLIAYRLYSYRGAIFFTH
jgi:hypothetical protein